MKLRLSFAFVISFLVSAAIAGVAHAQVTVPNYWVINTSSSTISPRIPGLQVPCADVSGGCAGGGVSPTSTNNFTVPQTFNGISNTGNVTSTSFIAQNTTTASYFENNNYRLGVPSPAMLAVMGMDVNTWIQNVYNTMNGTVSSTEFDFGAYNYSTTAKDVFGTNDERVIFDCVPGGGTQIVWNGTGTEYSFNTGDDHYWGSGISQCTAKGPSKNGTTTFASWGGSFGSEGFTMNLNRVSGFGSPFYVATNTWAEQITNNIFTDNGNEGVFAAAGGSANAGETPNITGNTFTEPSSTPAMCVQFLSNSLAGANITGNHFDDCWPYFANVQGVYFGANHLENPNWTFYNSLGQGTSSWELLATSTFEQVTNVGNFFVNDETSSTTAVPKCFVDNGSNAFSSLGDTVNSFGSSTPKFDCDEASFGSSFLQNFHNVSSSVTNVINTDSAANGCQIIMTAQDSFSGAICVTSNNQIKFVEGGNVVGVLNSSGHWNLGGSTSATTTVYAAGSQGGLSNVTNFSTTITTANGKNLFFTGSANASATLPAWNASQGADFVINNDSTSSVYQLQVATTTSDSVFDCLTGATTTFILLPKESTTSSIEVVNDGITTGIWRTICSAH